MTLDSSSELEVQVHSMSWFFSPDFFFNVKVVVTLYFVNYKVSSHTNKFEPCLASELQLKVCLTFRQKLNKGNFPGKLYFLNKYLKYILIMPSLIMYMICIVKSSSLLSIKSRQI